MQATTCACTTDEATQRQARAHTPTPLPASRLGPGRGARGRVAQRLPLLQASLPDPCPLRQWTLPASPSPTPAWTCAWQGCCHTRGDLSSHRPQRSKGGQGRGWGLVRFCTPSKFRSRAWWPTHPRDRRPPRLGFSSHETGHGQKRPTRSPVSGGSHAPCTGTPAETSTSQPRNWGLPRAPGPTCGFMGNGDEGDWPCTRATRTAQLANPPPTAPATHMGIYSLHPSKTAPRKLSSLGKDRPRGVFRNAIQGWPAIMARSRRPAEPPSRVTQPCGPPLR